MKTNLQDIASAMCEYFKIDAKMIFTNNRKYPSIKYRQYFIYLAYNNAECTYKSLGEFMKKKGMKYGTNHANLTHHNYFIADLRKNDIEVDKQLSLIESLFNNLNTLIPYEFDLLELSNNNTIFYKEIQIKPNRRFFYANTDIDKICKILKESEFKESVNDKKSNKLYLFIDRLDKNFVKVDGVELFNISDNIRKQHNIEVRKTRSNNMFRL